MLVLRSQMWQRIDDFIRVFISFLYSTKEEIGFDPTVKRVIFHKEICYVYQVGGRFFRTIKPLFLSRVLCITGRKTRVWEAVEVSGTSKEEIGEEMNGGKRFAVKDMWLDKDSSTEKENLDKIFAALDEVDMNKYEWDPSFNTTDNTYLQQIIGDVLREKEYNRYFMDIVCDQRGKLTREPAQDAVPDPKMFDTNPMPQMAKQTRSGTQQLSQQSSKYSGRSGSVLQPYIPVTIKPSSSIDLYMMMLVSHLMRQQISSHFLREFMMLVLVCPAAVR